MTKQSQNEKVLSYLKIENWLTTWDAIRWWRLTRLGARIYDLKKLGYNIKTEIVYRAGTHYARYRLEKRK